MHMRLFAALVIGLLTGCGSYYKSFGYSSANQDPGWKCAGDKWNQNCQFVCEKRAIVFTPPWTTHTYFNTFLLVPIVPGGTIDFNMRLQFNQDIAGQSKCSKQSLLFRGSDEKAIQPSEAHVYFRSMGTGLPGDGRFTCDFRFSANLLAEARYKVEFDQKMFVCPASDLNLYRREDENVFEGIQKLQ
jgi:hypothetical protein